MKQQILQFLSLNSTWRGLLLLATVCGARLSPENSQIILEFGLGLVGFLLVATKK